MINKIDVANSKISKFKRRRIWEIEEGRICSVIGTCLKCSELRRLARKKQFGLDAHSSDYRLHSILVNQAGIRSPVSRTLNKILDTKYRLFNNRYAKVKDDQSIKKLWDEDVSNGEIPGAYWAIITHPYASGELIGELYGQIHMMGHEVHGDYQKDQRMHAKLRKKVSTLESALDSDRQQQRQEKQQLEDKLSELKQVDRQYKALLVENKELQIAKERLAAGVSESCLVIELKKMKQELNEFRLLNAKLYGQLDDKNNDLQEQVVRLELAEASMSNIEEVNSRLLLEKEELQQEMTSMESTVLLNMNSTGGCENCMDQNTEHCPGSDLCGQLVLYVGGQRKMIPHYKRLIEKHGGRFIHHDGGKEVARAMLPKMLAAADVVLCPIDCISHDACICVKKICKRYQKPFVFMRSSGLSSLAKGISDIIQ